MNNNIEVPKDDLYDHGHKVFKGLLGMIPFVGSLTTELFTIILPSSIDKRRTKWMEQVVEILDELSKKDLIKNLQDNEEFVSIFLETSRLAMKTHQEEKVKLLANVLRNSITVELDFFKKQHFASLIDDLNSYQIKILGFLYKYQSEVAGINSYEKFYNMFRNGSLSSDVILDKNIDATTVRFFLKDLDRKGLIIISDSIGELEGFVRGFDRLGMSSSSHLPYIVITDIGKDFLEFLKDT